MARLVLLCGLPGSGKSTLARRLAVELPAVRLPPDAWMARLGFDAFDEEARDRIERVCWDLTQDLLRLGASVILESGFWLRAERDEKRLAARAIGVPVELRYLDVPLDELVRWVEARSQSEVGAVRLTRAHLEGWLPLFMPPDSSELALFDPPN